MASCVLCWARKALELLTVALRRCHIGELVSRIEQMSRDDHPDGRDEKKKIVIP